MKKQQQGLEDVHLQRHRLLKQSDFIENWKWAVHFNFVDKATMAVHSRTWSLNPREGAPKRHWPGKTLLGSMTSCTAVAHECAAAREKKIGALCTPRSPAATAQHLLWCSFHLQVLHVFRLGAKIHIWFVFLKVLRVKLHLKEEKLSPKYSHLDVPPAVFVIEAVLRGQVLRKTSLCGEKCTGNKPKWHWEVHLSAMINGAYASWMGLAPLPRWLAVPERAGTSASTSPAWAQRWQTSRICLKFWLRKNS